MHKQQGWPQAWECCQAKPIQTLGRASKGVTWSWSQCIKSHHAQTSSGKWLPSHFWNRNIVRSILPGLRRKITGLWLSGPKSSFQIKVNVALVWKSRSQSLEEEWRGTEYMLLEVQCEVFTVSDDLGCHVLCWCCSTLFSEVHSQHSHRPGHFRALHASFCWQALWRCWFHFPAGLGTCPHCQRYQKLVQWPWCYCAWLSSKLAWPGPLLSRGRWETPDPTMQITWRPLSKQPGLHYTWAVPRADCLHATLHWCSNSCKYWVQRNEHTFQKPDISVKKYTFLLILCNINIFWDTEFGVFIICKP